MPKNKRVKDSSLENQTFVVFHNQLNPLGSMYGGELMKIIDEAGAIVSRRHSEKICVTASIDSLNFLAPVFLGEMVVVKAAVNRVWNTSMEVGVKVIVERGLKTIHIASAYLTFVALDSQKKPALIPPITPETKEEKRRHKEADSRRKLRLSSHQNKP